MLSIRTRQTYLKALGFYTGKVDGIEGTKTKAAYKALQKKHFIRKSDIDGIYGTNTEKLLKNAYRVKKYTKNFDLSEFRCGCDGKYCTGYPAELSIQLLKNLQKVRDKDGATTITSGMRCKTHNGLQKGSSKTSRHLSGKALDIRNAKTASESGRKSVMAYVKTLSGHNYTYANIGGSHPNMGRAVHFDVK